MRNIISESVIITNSNILKMLVILLLSTYNSISVHLLGGENRLLIKVSLYNDAGGLYE